MGGATGFSVESLGELKGLSPRGRGNLLVVDVPGLVVRSIPAWAGQPRVVEYQEKVYTVYPRVGGATARSAPSGSSSNGLSPRGRGNQGNGGPNYVLKRSIPAWAGQPPLNSWASTSAWVYPRVGGATEDCGMGKTIQEGLSPRGRGNLVQSGRVGVFAGSIPAWAGQPRIPFRRPRPKRVYPRVGGATYTLDRHDPSLEGLSPRGRGNPSGGS